MLSTWRRPYNRSLLRLIVCSSSVITPWSRWSDSSSETQNYWETPFPPPAGRWVLVLGGSLQSTDTALWESFLGRNVFFIIKNSWTSLWFPHPSGKLRSLNLPKLLLCFAMVSQCALVARCSPPLLTLGPPLLGVQLTCLYLVLDIDIG